MLCMLRMQCMLRVLRMLCMPCRLSIKLSALLDAVGFPSLDVLVSHCRLRLLKTRKQQRHSNDTTSHSDCMPF